MIRCFLIRHADAGARVTVDDDRRGLTDRGMMQAAGIAAALDGEKVGVVLASPFRRCVETVMPLATASGLTVEVDDRLAEGSGPSRVLQLFESTTAPAAVCSHGDVLGDVLSRLYQRGVPLDDDRLAKGSMWIVSVDAGEPVGARYVPPPG